MKNIQIDLLQRKTTLGLQIKAFRAGYDKHLLNAETNDIHRDDHYIFFLLTKGSGSLQVNVTDITLTATSLYYILPSQLHSRIKPEQAEGWFLAIDSSLISTEFKQVFENSVPIQLPVQVTGHELQRYNNLLDLLYTAYSGPRDDKYYAQMVQSMAQSFLAMAASSYNAAHQTGDAHNRPAELVSQFKNLLTAHCHAIKSPSGYAAKLNISSGYLNEILKSQTGSTATYWIQQAIFNEAKRLLYYSNEDIKQISYQLGYKDYSYFVRTFRKACGLTPVQFRKLNSK